MMLLHQFSHNDKSMLWLFMSTIYLANKFILYGQMFLAIMFSTILKKFLSLLGSYACRLIFTFDSIIYSKYVIKSFLTDIFNCLIP